MLTRQKEIMEAPTYRIWINLLAAGFDRVGARLLGLCFLHFEARAAWLGATAQLHVTQHHDCGTEWTGNNYEEQVIVQ